MILVKNKMFEVLHTVYYPNYQPASHMSTFFYRKYKMTHFLIDFSCCCNAKTYSRMANKLYKWSNFDIGVIRKQCKATEGRKTEILWAKKKKKKKKRKKKKNHQTKSHLKICALIFCCKLLVKTCCQNTAIESHKNVISVIKIRGILQFLTLMCISRGASCGIILWLSIDWSETEPEDHWSCIAHLSAEDMLKSAVIEEKMFKHSPWAGADNTLGPKLWCQQEGLITIIICCKLKKNPFNRWLYIHLFMI